MIMMSVNIIAQDIKLPVAQKNGGKPLMQVLNERMSIREYSQKEISMQTLSNLLWAAWGFNRDFKRTAPSAMDKQEIDIYVFLKKGTYLYLAKENILKFINNKDLRKTTGMQPYVETAPLNIVYIANADKAAGNSLEEKMPYMYADAAFIAENVYLFCASFDLGCVVRGYINRSELKKELQLKPNQEITLAQTVGYKK